MAFGKDDRHLAGIPSYGGSTAQKAANATRTRKRSGNSGSKRPYWVDTFKLDLITPATIRLLPVSCKTMREDGELSYEEETPWAEFVEHFHGTYSCSAICSGGPFRMNKKLREPCHGCDIFWDDFTERKNNGQTGKGSKGKNKISKSDKFAFAVLDMGNFHKVPQRDSAGSVRMNAKNEPYTDWVRCKGRGCQDCHIAIESKAGHVLSWAMAKAHFNTLMRYGDSIGNSCTTCSGRSVITTEMWQCGNPACGDLIFDLNTTTATQEQVQETVSQPYACRQCGSTAYPVEVISCVNCTPRGEAPARASVFDVDMQVIAVKTGDGDSTIPQVLACSDPKPVSPEFAEAVKYLPDLTAKFSPTPLSVQAEMWKVQTKPGVGPNPGGYVVTK